MANEALSPDMLSSSRVPINMSDTIYDLNIDKTPLLKLLSMIGKESSSNMKYEWMTEERKLNWGTVSSFGGAWATAANVAGTIVVPAGEIGLYAVNDIVKLPSDTNTNIYITAINTSTYTLTGHSVDNTTTIDLSAGTTGTNKIFKIGNAVELGSGRSQITSQQPSDNYNYIQLFQTPFGVVETTKSTKLRGGDALSREGNKKGIEHAFDIEQTLFFGQKHKATTGYMNGEYEQYFTGGLYETIATNVQDELSGSLTQTEFDNFIDMGIYYADKPIIFAGTTISKALNVWMEGNVRVGQTETVLGLSVNSYKTYDGKIVKIISHKHLLKNAYSGFAFCVDLADIKYKYLDGHDTKLYTNLQAPDVKQTINEYRTWGGLWLGNEKRHGVLKNVASIA